MDPQNLLIIMADELTVKALGCYGNSQVITPNLDRMAAEGTVFDSAYTPSPVCVPARATVATGRYAHETGYWDNVIAYDGTYPSWGHRLRELGCSSTSIGKLHYSDEDADTGFDEQILPMHVYAGGDVYGLERENPPHRPQSSQIAHGMAVQDSEFTEYDQNIATEAGSWLSAKASEADPAPWTLFVSFISPHFPLVVPQKYYDLYVDVDIPVPGKRGPSWRDEHPWWQTYRDCYDFDRYFDNDEQRREAVRIYWAMCSFVDEQVGRVLEAVKAAGLDESTRILFTADHGENLGERGFWGKSNMYEDSARVPLIATGPGVPAGARIGVPVSLADIYPTVLDTVGAEPTEAERALPGVSLWDTLDQGGDPQRTVFSEYHGSCARTGVFMLRRGAYKYVHYTHYEPELFDLEADPEEALNLAQDPAFTEVLKDFRAQLLKMVDPGAVDRAAKAAQKAKLEELGGMDKIVAAGGFAYTPAPGRSAERVSN